jgi:hypothetical protein
MCGKAKLGTIGLGVMRYSMHKTEALVLMEFAKDFMFSLDALINVF